MGNVWTVVGFFDSGFMMVVRDDVLNNGIKSSNLHECIS